MKYVWFTLASPFVLLAVVVLCLLAFVPMENKAPNGDLFPD